MPKSNEYILYSENMEFPAARPLPWVAKLDDVPGMNCSYSLHWNMPFDPDAEPKPAPGQRVVGHPPHMHKENEIIYLFGMNPGDPFDLGAEVEICIGEQMERHVITRSCCLRIPGGTPHGFYHINRCDRPWMFVEIHEGNPKTEKFLWEYLTQEEIASIPERAMQFWKDVGYDE